MIKGIIFDFNGTLFWDSLLHDKAWLKFISKYNLRIPSVMEMRNHIHGKGTHDIIEFVFGEKKSTNEVHEYTQKKEAIYRDLVLSDKAYKELAPGALILLNYLKANKIPTTIATSSEEGNVNFFFKHFNLDKWFDREKVVYDNGKFDLKPAPDIFLMAANNINTQIEQCLILEDSPSGIVAAKKSGAKKVVYVENNSPCNFNEVKPFIDFKITCLDRIIDLFFE